MQFISLITWQPQVLRSIANNYFYDSPTGIDDLDVDVVSTVSLVYPANVVGDAHHRSFAHLRDKLCRYNCLSWPHWPEHRAMNMQTTKLRVDHLHFGFYCSHDFDAIRDCLYCCDRSSINHCHSVRPNDGSHTIDFVRDEMDWPNRWPILSALLEIYRRRGAPTHLNWHDTNSELLRDIHASFSLSHYFYSQLENVHKMFGFRFDTNTKIR